MWIRKRADSLSEAASNTALLPRAWSDPERALTYGSRTYSGADLSDVATSIATSLRAVARPRGFVAVDVESPDLFVGALEAAVRVGAGVLPLQRQLPQRMRTRLLDQVRPTQIVFEDDGAPVVEQYGNASVGNQASSDLALLTSGSRGAPSVVYRTWQSMLIDRSLNPEVWFTTFPLGSISGLTILVRSIFSGAHLKIPQTADSRSIVSLFETEPVPSMCVVPPHVAEALARLVPREILCRLKVLGVGGAPVSSKQAAALRTIPARVVVGYGTTEIGAGVIVGDLSEPVGGSHIALTTGTAVPGVQVSIRRPDDTVIVSPEETGVLWCRSMRSSQAPEAWVETGDLARWTSNGAVVIVGRADGSILRGDAVVNVETIEEVLLSVPGVEEAVVTVTNVRRGDLAAVVRGAAEISASMLRDELALRLLPAEVPQHIVVAPADEPLRNASGKIPLFRIEQLLRSSIRSGDDGH